MPALFKEIRLSDEDRANVEAGLWGIGFCPDGRHFDVWQMSDTPPSGEFALADYLQRHHKINLDNFEEQL